MELVKLKRFSKNLTVLYVEDDTELRKSVERYLNLLFKSVDVACDGEDGLEKYQDATYDLVITDIKMPRLTGLEMAQKIKEVNEYQNILIVSAYTDTKSFTDSIKLGVDGYIIKPIDYDQLNTALYKTCYKIKTVKENKIYKNNLEELVKQKINHIKILEEEKVDNYKQTLYALVKMIEDRDTYTGGHSLRVASYAKLIAQQLGLDKKICENIYQAGILHDIGKVAIPDNVLLKPGSLDDLEFTLIKEHVSMGTEILNKVPMFKELATFIEQHHERLDGSGYPNGKKDDEILLESQILAVSDAFDAMTTNRIYKARKTVTEALDEIDKLKGIHFRELVVKAALLALKDVIIDESINQLPTTTIEKERFSYYYKDQITNSYNGNYLDLLLLKNSFDKQYNYIYQISIHNLNEINTKYGWQEGDEYLKDVYNHLESIYPDKYIFRVFSDDFLIISENKIIIDESELLKFIEKENGKVNFELIVHDLNETDIKSLHDIELKLL